MLQPGDVVVGRIYLERMITRQEERSMVRGEVGGVLMGSNDERSPTSLYSSRENPADHESGVEMDAADLHHLPPPPESSADEASIHSNSLHHHYRGDSSLPR